MLKKRHCSFLLVIFVFLFFFCSPLLLCYGLNSGSECSNIYFSVNSDLIDGDLVFDYNFSVRIGYKSGSGEMLYSGLAMGFVFEENDTMVHFEQFYGGLLDDLSSPVVLSGVSVFMNETGLVVKDNSSVIALGGTEGWANYSVSSGISIVDHTFLSKENVSVVLRWFYMRFISVTYVDGFELVFGSPDYLNISLVCDWIGSSWNCSIQVLSSLPSDNIELDVQNGFFTVFLDVPPPLDINLILLIVIPTVTIGVILVSVYFLNKRRRTLTVGNRDENANSFTLYRNIL